MSHRWDCPDRYESERDARRHAELDFEFDGYRSPRSYSDCEESQGYYEDAYRREMLHQEELEEERRAEEVAERRAADALAEEEAYWAQQQEEEHWRAQEEAEYARHLEAQVAADAEAQHAEGGP